MFKFLNLFKSKNSKYPKEIKNIWYNLNAHSSKTDYPKVFNSDGRYICCEVGLKCKMFKTEKGEAVIYEVIKMWWQIGDWLYDSDAIHCDMKFSHIE